MASAASSSASSLQAYLTSLGVNQQVIAEIMQDNVSPFTSTHTRTKRKPEDDEQNNDDADNQEEKDEDEEDEEEEPKPRKRRRDCHCEVGWECVINVSQTWRQRYLTTQMASLTDLCVKECGAGGDCMFYAVGRGYFAWKHPEWSDQQLSELADEHMKQARVWASEGVYAEDIDRILGAYQNEWYQDHVWRSKVNRPSPFSSWSVDDETWKPNRWGGTFTYRFPRTDQVPLEWRGREVRETFPIPPASALFLDVTHPQFRTFPVAIPQATSEQKQESIRQFKAATFRKLIRTTGEKFRGDDRALEWIANAQDSPLHQDDIGFIVISNMGRMQCGFYPNDRYVQRYMLLYSMHNAHWKLAGVSLADSQTGEYRTRSVFERDELPEVIQALWVADCITAQDAAHMDRDHPMRLYAQQKFPPVPQ